MKKIIIAILLVVILATSAYAVNIFDMVLCKKVILRANRMSVLVVRLTGEVKYILLNTGQWLFLEPGALKNQYQAMYDVQVSQ